MGTAEYSAAEVAKHNTTDDLWIIIDGDVYDLSRFKDLHPGGAPPLKLVAGKDATKDFYALHRKEVIGMPRYQRLKVGTLRGYKAPPPPAPTPYASPTYMRKVSPYYNESHHRFRKAMRDFIDREIVPTAADDDENGIDPSPELHKEMGEAGILCAAIGKAAAFSGIPLPGGVAYEEFDYFHDLIGAEEMKRPGTYGLSDGIIGGFSIGLPPVINFGSEDLRQRIALPCLKGEKRICLAISEPYAGSDVSSIKTEAVLSPDGSHYVVNGVKKWITSGRYSDYFTTLVNTEKGFALLLIERQDDQVSTKAIKTSYSSTAGTAYVEFNDAIVPVQNVVGEVGKGFHYTMSNFNHERWGMAVAGNAMSRKMVEEAFKWAAGREIFRKRLIDQPVIRFKLGQMVAEVESVHSMIEDVTYQMNNSPKESKDLIGPIAILKYKQTRAAELVADNICQIFGGRALTRTGMGKFVEKFHRSHKMQSILGGSEEIMADLAIREAVKGMGRNPARL
mmetsp:Transcript_35665/g.44231  ORF Transcript_35665/g.44231 Transcript_35665/m.44231 type:complete len:506 (+) Transcript_35665:69-1586(+)